MKKEYLKLNGETPVNRSERYVMKEDRENKADRSLHYAES